MGFGLGKRLIETHLPIILDLVYRYISSKLKREISLASAFSAIPLHAFNLSYTSSLPGTGIDYKYKQYVYACVRTYVPSAALGRVRISTTARHSRIVSILLRVPQYESLRLIINMLT